MRQQRTVHLPVLLDAKLKKLAVAQGKTTSSMIADLVASGLESEPQRLERMLQLDARIETLQRVVNERFNRIDGALDDMREHSSNVEERVATITKNAIKLMLTGGKQEAGK